MVRRSATKILARALSGLTVLDIGYPRVVPYRWLIPFGGCIVGVACVVLVFFFPSQKKPSETPNALTDSKREAVKARWRRILGLIAAVGVGLIIVLRVLCSRAVATLSCSGFEL
jgi:hypothetical protein